MGIPAPLHPSQKKKSVPWAPGTLQVLVPAVPPAATRAPRMNPWILTAGSPPFPPLTPTLFQGIKTPLSRLPKSNETPTDKRAGLQDEREKQKKHRRGKKNPNIEIRRQRDRFGNFFPLFRAWLGQVGLELGLVHGVQEVLGIHGQGVGSRQHLALEFRAEGSAGVLLRQAHLADEVGQVLVEQLLGALDLGKRGEFFGNSGRDVTPTFPGFLVLPRCGKRTGGWEGSRQRSR